MLRAERKEYVRLAVARLPLVQQQLLLLKYGQQLSYGQIAALLDMTPATVSTYLHRARTQLRQALKEMK